MSTPRDGSPSSTSTRVADNLRKPPWRTQTLAQKLSTATLHLTPAFFTITMGIGITSILLYTLPYNAGWLRIIGIVIFVLNVVLFVLLLLGTVVRGVLFEGVFWASIRHPVAGMFWGTMSMGLTTIVNMIAYAVVPAWGRNWAYLAAALYFVNVLVALLVNIGMLFIMFSRQSHTHESFGSTILLPVITAVVVASTGGVVGEPMLAYDPWLARACVLVAYIIWGIGTPTAFLIVGSWIHRSILYGYPPPSAIVSVFLPLGPFGQASFGVILLGRVLRETAHTGTPIAPSLDMQTNILLAEAIYAVSLVISLVIWGFAAVWYVLGTAICIDYHFNRSNRAFFSRSAFALNYWGLTFPIGVFAMGATELASQLDSGILRVIGTILSLQVVLHCIWVSWMTVWKAWDGSIFAAPEVLAMDGVVRRRWVPAVEDSTAKASA